MFLEQSCEGFRSGVELHILPKLDKVSVADLDQKDIRDTLAPIWHTKAETVRKALDRRLPNDQNRDSRIVGDL